MAYTTINKSTDYFNTVTYTGSAGGQTISGVGHQPDFIWVKQRTDAGYDHSLHNSVSGLLKQLISNSNSAEITNTDTVTSNNADGFVLGADSAGPSANSNNQDGKNYVAWNWKAGTTGSGTTGQNKTYNYSVNTTAGFSIMTYEGSGVTNHKIPHHLGAKPTVKFVKSTGHSENWTCYWDAFQDSSKYIQLNTTTAKQNDSGKWGGYDTSSLMNLGSDDDTNKAGSGVNFVAYCFAEKQGYSKFGSYTGNGNADGTFVYTGFKPAFVMMKRTNSTGSWHIHDSKRPSYNDTQLTLKADSTAAEDTGYNLDLLSNGFKLRNVGASQNDSGGNYIYMAFAEAPLVGTNNVPATAR